MTKLSLSTCRTRATPPRWDRPGQHTKLGGKAKLEIGLIRSHYIGRTFIQPDQFVRENKVKTKFNTVKGVLKDKVVVIVDDSIVRGTTSRQLVQLVRQAGPKEVHFRVTSPPIMHPCYYGMDFPTPKSLSPTSAGGMSRRSGRNSASIRIGYLLIDDLLSPPPASTGRTTAPPASAAGYPVPIDANQSKKSMKR